MNMGRSRLLSVTFFAGLLCAAMVVNAAPLTPAQKKELNDITSDVRKVASLVNRKKTDEAEAALKDAETRLETLIKEAELQENDPQLRAVQKVIETQQGILGKATG